jgi:anti-sigma B factor antagonist/stage II sporulation protein AA (anti-sigma F factor antagonist)
LDADHGVITASLAGEIDLSNASRLLATITHEVPNEAVGLIMDLSEVGYIDSSGLRMLLELAKRLGWRDQTMRVVVADDARIRRILSLSGVEPVLSIDASLEGARAHFANAQNP